VEEGLAGRPVSVSSIEAAARLAGASLQDVNSDIHAGEEYRRAMIPVFTGRALKRALERAG
jgi:CO/xanthine dehydrogenase FAD-binding subunit